MSEKKRDAGYHAALTGAKGTVRLLIYVCVILVIILAAKTSYQFGHDVFNQQAMSPGEGQEVTVVIKEDGSYVLNTAQTVDEMLEILAGVNTEGQPSAE